MLPVPAFRNQTVAVFGIARSGRAAVRALKAGGAKVVAWDDSAERRAEAEADGALIADLTKSMHGASALVLSPGVPLTHPAPHPVVAQARKDGAAIIGDIELFFRRKPQARVVGITGTNGKSTTTALIAFLLEACGVPAALGGNIGTPVLELADIASGGAYVLELSSFQIDLTPSIACDVAILLNVTPDHLDRHGDMDGYVAVKRRIFSQPTGATAIIGVDDHHCRGIWEELRAQPGRRVIPIAIGRRIDGGISVVEGRLEDRSGATTFVLDIAALATLRGAHNWQNTAAAFAAVRALGVKPEAIAAALPRFPGLAHRMETVATLGNVTFVNDSKATNADATEKALVCFDTIYWIAGGRAKVGGIEPLVPHFHRIRHAFLIGEAAADFARTLDGHVPVTLSGDMATAVRQAANLARDEGRRGAVVLLSPACSSFDQFRDFEQRGDAFRAVVAAVTGEDA